MSMNIREQLQSNTQPAAQLTHIENFYNNLQSFLDSAATTDNSFQSVVDFLRKCRNDKAAAYPHFENFSPNNQDVTNFMQAVTSESSLNIIPLSYFLEFKTFFKGASTASVQGSQYV